MTNIDDHIKTCKNLLSGAPRIALPPHLKSFRSSHIAKAGLTPLGQVVKPEPARYRGNTTPQSKPSARPALVKRIRVKK